jgi:glycosyltransferase involved in cell wall biosynthesis
MTVMKSATPLVSVCIPVFNGERFIVVTIESVLRQTFTDFELIIVDDHSSDRSVEIISAYNDDRLRVVINDRNLGAEGNWNRCLTEAKGRYFKLLPQDDVLAPTCLAKQVSVLDQDKEKRVALVFCARSIIDAAGSVLMSRGYPGGSIGVINGRLLIRRCLCFGANLIGEPGSVLFRRDLAMDVGLFDAGAPYVIDLDYWSRLLLRGDGYYLPEKLSSFRVYTGSWSVAIGGKQSEEFRRFVARISRNPDFGTRYIDVLMANLMARVNNVMRMLIYRFVLKRG